MFELMRILIIALAVMPVTAHASSCTRDCEVNCTNAENNSACTSACSSNCLDVIEERNNANGGCGPARMNYGAIAVSPSTFKYGYSWSQPSQNQANAVAFENCSAQDCRIELTFLTPAAHWR